MKKLRESLKRLPPSPGVYFFKDRSDRVIYVGKAGSLKNRIRQYFLKSRATSPRMDALLKEIKAVDWIECLSEIDALIEEAKFIKKYRPKFNVLLRDDKNYFFVGITKEEYPCIFITHQPLIKHSASVVSRQLSVVSCSFIGPFTDGAALKQTLKILRRVFPCRRCRKAPKRPAGVRDLARGFAPYAIPGSKAEIRRNIRAVVNALSGKRQSVLEKLQKQMIKAARSERFDLAEKYKDQAEYMRNVFAHRRFLEELPIYRSSTSINVERWSATKKQIQSLLNIKIPNNRVEGYDISNIGGQYAVGSMIVFVDGLSDKSQYRRFKIKYSGETPDDPKMMAEILARRMRHTEWPTPDLVIVDGGITQLNAARSVLPKNQPVISLAKKEEEIYAPHLAKPIHADRFGNETKLFLQHLRDEAHRFAISYHRKLRGKALR